MQCYDGGGYEVALDTIIDRDGNVTIRANHPIAECAILLLASYLSHNGARYYFTAGDWTRSRSPTDYFITIQCYSNSGEPVYIDASVGSADDVTIRSNDPLLGKLLIFKA
jgi:hypothetical protein